MKLVIGNFYINTVSDGASVNVGTTLNLIDLSRLSDEKRPSIPEEERQEPRKPMSPPPGVIGPNSNAMKVHTSQYGYHLPPI